MAIQLVTGQVANSNSAGSTVTTQNVVLPNPPANGNLVIVACATSGSQPQLDSSTDITWMMKAQQANATRSCFIFVGRVVTGSASATITVTQSTASSMVLVAMEFSGFTNPRVDRSAGTNATSGTAVASGATPTTSSANQLWIGVLASMLSGGNTFSSPTNSFVLDASGQTKTSLSTANDRSVALLYQVVSSTGTANAGAAATSGAWSAEVITIEETPSSGSSAHSGVFGS